MIGETDPLLVLIPTGERPSTAASSAAVPLTSDDEAVFDHLLTTDVSLHEPSGLAGAEFDLGFYFEDSSTQQLKDPLNTTAEESAETLNTISEELEANLEDMIQTAQMHPRSLQVGAPFRS